MGAKGRLEERRTRHHGATKELATQSLLVSRCYSSALILDPPAMTLNRWKTCVLSRP